MHYPKKALLLCGLLSVTAACSSKSEGNSDTCNPGDQDGMVGGDNIVLVNVSDTGYAVGGVDSGSTEPNISVQNFAHVTLTLTNVGTTPHSLRIACIPTELPQGCPTMSCFPDNASIPALDPGQSATVSFVTPAVEGAYPFTSDVAGDSTPEADGGELGLVGEFVLM
jgi:hypothetical protein